MPFIGWLPFLSIAAAAQGLEWPELAAAPSDGICLLQVASAQSPAEKTVGDLVGQAPGSDTIAGLARKATDGYCDKVVFLRIQKTGSTSFGEVLLPHMCQVSHQSCDVHDGQRHLDYVEVMRRVELVPLPSVGCGIALLRDPVERTLSEFFFLWSKERTPPYYSNLDQEQWDVTPKDALALRAILKQEDVATAFLQYLHFATNPSRNRQTLYLLGFVRVGCKEELGCTGSEDTEHAHGYPAKQYDWETHGDALLEVAKKHLANLAAFGIADCYDESLDSISRTVGWSPSEVTAFTSKEGKEHKREQDASVYDAAQQLHASVASSSLFRVATKSSAATLTRLMARARTSDDSDEGVKFLETDSDEERDEDHATWTSLVSPAVAAEIRAVNSVDVKLMEYARLLLVQQYGQVCAPPQ